MFFFVYKSKTFRVNSGILPGNSKSLWDAVKIAKDQNNPSLPENMTLNNIKNPNTNVPIFV